MRLYPVYPDLETAVVTNGCRFKVMRAQLPLLGRSREFVLPPLAPRYAQDLCRRTQVDGLVAKPSIRTCC